METAAPRRSLDIFNTTSSGDSDSQTIGACPENADAQVQLAPDTRSLSLVEWPSTTTTTTNTTINTTTAAAAAATAATTATTATTTTPPTSSPPLDRTITRPSQPRPLCLPLPPPPPPSLPPPSRPSTRLPPLCVPLSPNSEFSANRGLPRPTSAQGPPYYGPLQHRDTVAATVPESPAILSTTTPTTNPRLSSCILPNVRTFARCSPAPGWPLSANPSPSKKNNFARLRPNNRGRNHAAAMPGRPIAGSSGFINNNPVSAPPPAPNSTTGTTKRPADGDIGGNDEMHSAPGGKMKLPRLDRSGGNSNVAEDFSSVVKNRLQSYTRTGQACDRCKVRKIRCDALPEGCSHCINLSLDCYVTDRVTGRTERRGYMQELEREKNNMISHIRDLEKLLAGKGVEVKPWEGSKKSDAPSSTSPSDQTSNGQRPSQPDEDWGRVGSLWVKDAASEPSRPSTGSRPFIIPNFPRSQLPSRPEETNLGVGFDSRPLSSISGTQLTIMGTTIDTAAFTAPDVDEPAPDDESPAPLYNKSVHAFIQSTMGVNPPLQVKLPPKEEGYNYANWYFWVMASYIPVLHKPTFMRLLERMYEEPGYQATPTEEVIVHMVFAIITYQYGVRNWADAVQRSHLNDQSNNHYHYSLSKFPDLMTSRDLEAVQAMTLIAAHTRAFPKPGCGSLISNLAFQRALEMNLHREPKNKPASGTNLGIEMRKRTWWTLLSLCVSTTGRRGRPMVITVEEFDTSFPEPIADELLTEEGVDESKSEEVACGFEVGLATFKIIPIMMEMYSNIYSVRVDAANYPKIVYALEKQLQDWEDNLPDSLKMDQATNDQPHLALAPLYVRMFGLEMRIWLRHNSVNPTKDPKMIMDNTRICEETAREYLHTVQQVIELKSLDTTWTQASIYAMSLFSMLVAHWERRRETTPEQVTILRQEMNEWLAVFDELGQLMGSGPGLRDQISSIVDRTIAWIENDMPAQKAKSQPVGTPVRLKKEQSQADLTTVSTIPPRPLTTPAQSSQSAQMLPTQTASQPRHKHSTHSAPQPTPHTAPPPPHAHSAPTAAPSSQPAHPQTNAVPVTQQQVDASKGYYHDHAGMNGHATYGTSLSYNNHHQESMAPPGYDPQAALFYPGATQHATAAAAMGTGAEAHANQVLAFASQSAHIDPTMMWRGGSGWADWTAAIQEADHRFGATALMSMGGGNTTPVSRASMGGSVMGDAGHTAPQWPTLVFPDGHGHHHPQPQHHHIHHHGAPGI